MDNKKFNCFPRIMHDINISFSKNDGKPCVGQIIELANDSPTTIVLAKNAYDDFRIMDEKCNLYESNNTGR